MPTSIPPWTPRGVLPPNDALDPVSASRSPYTVSLLDLVMRFGTSRPRLLVLDGMLRFRKALHAMGAVEGFQWLDGSFTEDCETLEGRPPADIDVVTFFEASSRIAPAAPHDTVFDHPAAKREFQVDAYFVELDLLPPAMITSISTYWYSIWSHRRTQEWKGYLQIPLRRDEDDAAASWVAGAIGLTP